jgi:hypothetical protein
MTQHLHNLIIIQFKLLSRLFLRFQGVYVSGIEMREEGDIGIVLVDLKRQEDG